MRLSDVVNLRFLFRYLTFLFNFFQFFFIMSFRFETDVIYIYNQLIIIMSAQKKGILSLSRYQFKGGKDVQLAQNIKKKVQTFITTQSSNVSQLGMYRTILKTKLQDNFNKVEKKSIQQLSLSYLPFIFNISQIPLQVQLSLASIRLNVSATDIGKLQQLESKTLQLQAYKAIQSSCIYGTGQIQQAISKLKLLSGTNIKNMVAGFTTYVASLFAGKTEKETETGFKQKIQGGIKQMEEYLKTIKSYGQYLINFYYLLNFAQKTDSYGRRAYYVPTIPNLLFTLQYGQPKVYLKTSNNIRLVPKSQFTYAFLSGVVKGMIAKGNADIINSYNDSISNLESGKKTRKQVFLEQLKKK